MTSFIVYTLPATQGSMKQVTDRYGRTHIIHDNSAKVKATRHDIAAAARAAWGDRPCLTDCPVTLTITAYLIKPKTVKRAMPHAAGRFDVDKIARLVCDSLTGICYRDDGQIVDLVCRKRYAAMPGIEISIEEVS